MEESLRQNAQNFNLQDLILSECLQKINQIVTQQIFIKHFLDGKIYTRDFHISTNLINFHLMLFLPKYDKVGIIFYSINEETEIQQKTYFLLLYITK